MPDGHNHITLITYDGQPQLTPSDELVARELMELGISVQVASWSDPSVDWSKTGLAVLRSTWDAHTRAGEFQQWLLRIESLTSVCNSVNLLRWNFDKRYLIDLSARGISIVPSIYFEPQSTRLLSRADVPWERVVVKPSIGGSSHGVRKFDSRTELDALNDHLTDLLRSKGALVQRFEQTVETLAERSLVFIQGQYTHAVRRVPFNRGNTPDTSDFDHFATSEEIAFALQVLTVAGARDTPFARVDLLPSADALLVMELELLDPSLFLTRNPPAARQLALALRARLESRLGT
jgi:glutathione synthase/RimK-type ligase-like ATP-grasp enzyme